MSYAQAAARGPKQSPEEVCYDLLKNGGAIALQRAPPPPQIEHDDPTVSLIDVDSPHVSSVPSDYHGETETQKRRIENEAADAERAMEVKFAEAEEKAHKGYDKAKKASVRKGKEAKAEAKEAAHELNANKDNPVVIANMAVIGLGGAALAFGAYKKHQAGELDWKLAGFWGGMVGLFAVGDYYLSQYLFKNKYPKK